MAEHDFRNRTWGHNIEFISRDPETGKWLVAIWSYRLALGDTILVRVKNDLIRYTIEKIKWCGDPEDMYWANLSYPEVVDG